jgi:hypothetical protein
MVTLAFKYQGCQLLLLTTLPKKSTQVWLNFAGRFHLKRNVNFLRYILAILPVYLVELKSATRKAYRGFLVTLASSSMGLLYLTNVGNVQLGPCSTSAIIKAHAIDLAYSNHLCVTQSLFISLFSA